MLHYETLGEVTDTIVFLHGIGGTSRYWKNRVLPLTTNYRLILIDLLGYGQSPKPWAKYTVDRHVEEIYQVLHEHESLTIVGHSFGCPCFRSTLSTSGQTPGLYQSALFW